MTVAQLRARLADMPPEFDTAQVLVLGCAPRAERMVATADAVMVRPEDPERVERYLALRLAEPGAETGDETC